MSRTGRLAHGRTLTPFEEDRVVMEDRVALKE
jgi:hypothetical protein